MKRLYPFLVGLVVVVLLQGCGGGGGSSPTEPVHANVAGTWDVTGTNDLGQPVQGTATLAQQGQSVSGTWSSSGLGGDLAGTVSGRNLTFSLAQGGLCPGTANGSASVSGDNRSMSGSYSGSDCTGSGSVSFTATKR